ncbi:dTDP-4-dehydrorhamnose reductase [Paraflavitalea pollutisoli]|uniref:dTDP-4-dehydrorhamnose reductase n=1 Tax=Paraflavitalea pollutisoli TaxID=3034143 RepID=UPI0023ED1C3E|nr:dTDP-4-dehydrorhamnose reductase [Paraflavitalea sp. H1-2-19X]
MAKPKVLVTGANGQVGQSLRDLAVQHPALDFVFVTKDELPIHRFELVANYFDIVKPAFCINAAAYTAVDKAETDKEMAYQVNGDAVGVLASVCRKFGTRFLHISTDYVFDGTSPEPYKENTPTNPINTYGVSKLRGEALGLLHNADTVIIRTAWVYCEHGNNFVKTMLRLMKDRPTINVVSDQVGAPTYAGDLAQAMIAIIERTATQGWVPGIYHYSNTGRISWYDFALAIKELSGSHCEVLPIPSSQYPTPAKRPSFSLLDTQKIQATYELTIPAWKDSLQRCLQRLA